MDLIYTNAAALAVAALFYVWRAYAHVQAQRICTLRHRVAFMLWVMADKVH